ncbi:hypothetical protein K491DRAFT_588488 [Lophiostoma macrostomum CBS 122681]|uniref:PHD-type domain-containing protein n=1 Tax=Lophiostoma macrostomum CBS 122681 TaxID=1314788 RepID=A0A6A6TQL8_9PLEO|nr:hypothetical protein K491DRAFT_588488 [Lophiostoma macrostomum CBS 122681]
MTPQPAANPDAQTTVNDFLDYTEFFPSDLFRSLRLIGDLDLSYSDATQAVHELTKTYGTLPDIAPAERPDPVALRREIAAALDKAIYCRESSYAEAARLYEVAERHNTRIKIIKKKLQALPQPPSRDPTPVPVSPQAVRPYARNYDRTPRLHIHFDASRHGASTGRPRDRSRKYLHRAHSPGSSSDSGSGADSDTGSATAATSRIKLHKDKTPKLPKPARPRPSGSNQHTQLSTSTALAMLSPPPPNAKPGSRFAPWFKLTEYEMAVLRKQMKKNAFWTPSDTMIRRELERKERGHSFYEKEKARCEATGEDFLDEEPDKPSAAKIDRPPSAIPTHDPANAETNATPIEAISVASPVTALEPVSTPVELSRDLLKEDTATVNKGMKLNEAKEAKKVRRESQREQAMRDAQGLEDATRKIQEAAEGLQELNFPPDNVTATPIEPRRRSVAKQNLKRKRDSSPTATIDTPTANTREPSHASQDSGAKPPGPKRIRLPNIQPVAPGPGSADSSVVSPGFVAASNSQTATPVAPSPVANTPAPLLADTGETTIQVPLAPAGPATPGPVERAESKAPSQRDSPAVVSPREPQKTTSPPVSAQTTATAASSRPRRESAAPAKVAVITAASIQPTKPTKAQTPAPEPVRASPVLASRPRSARGTVPTPKAQSEEPKPNDAGKPTRELRRHSVFSQPAIAAPTRMSTRKKPPPKGDTTSADNGQKTVTNVKRAHGSKKRKKAGEDTEPADEIGDDEERYCICDDFSFGTMIMCDNECERQWFHLECVNMDMPPRRSKWYCPDCRQKLATDAFGNPIVPPPLPGRRGNR